MKSVQFPHQDGTVIQKSLNILTVVLSGMGLIAAVVSLIVFL